MSLNQRLCCVRGHALPREASRLVRVRTAAPSSSVSSASSARTPSLFVKKRQLPKFVQLDHEARRKERVLNELAEVGKRQGLSREKIVEHVAKLESLLPQLNPRLDKMKASDWVQLVKDVDQVAIKLVVLKTFYPTADLGSIISRSPKFLLQSMESLQADAKQIRVILGDKLSKDAVIEAVPDLMRPQQAALTLSNLRRWFPTSDPYELLQKNPKILFEIEECDLDPDPTYGWTSNFFNDGSVSGCS